MNFKLALIGNPNCGKTTLFNHLTGSNQYVGNWAGVTVEKKEGKIKGENNLVLTDLPGIYSLSPYTLEEVITRDYLLNEKPDLIINIVDASNIERNLYLTTQVIELGIPVIIALNMVDIVEKNGDFIKKDLLSQKIGCPVVEICALKGEGVKNILKEVKDILNNNFQFKVLHIFSDKVESDLSEIQKMIYFKVDNSLERWTTIKLFENDTTIFNQINLTDFEKNKIKSIVSKTEHFFDDDCEAILINERYNFISSIKNDIFFKNNSKNLTISDKIDKVVTNKYLALPIFFSVIFFIYLISVSFIGSKITDWTNDVFFGEYVNNFAISFLEKINVSPWLNSLIIDGILSGVGAVLGFVPQMAILFFCLSILEDCGYMARIAFIMDRTFRRFGVSGKSFIPFLISSGCGVPGIMASRTIENQKERMLTIMITTFIPCSAKLTIVSLLAASLFPSNIFIGPSIYFLGIFAVVISGIILKKTKFFACNVEPFVMELPQYHFPSFKSVFLNIWEKVKSFIVKAGTVIFFASIIIWFLVNFNLSFQMVDAEKSILAYIGNLVAPIFYPLGFGNWQATVATLNGIIAKEQVVSMFGIILGLGEVSETDHTLIHQVSNLFTGVSAYSFMAFNMLCAPCVAAIGAIKREMGGWKFTLITIAYQTVLAYLVAFVIYQIGTVIFLKTTFNILTIFAIIITLFILYLIFRKNKNI